MTMSQGANHTKGWLLVLGFLFVLLGCVGMGMVVGLTIVSMIFFGVLLIIAGLSHLFSVFQNKKWKGAFWEALIALFYIAGGIMVIQDPLLASSIITMALAVMFIIIGVSRLIMAFVLKDVQGWGWMLVAGIAAVVLGVMILMHWPLSGLWVIGMLIAIEMMITGWTYVMIAMAMPKAL